jgi:hypothetical protein
MVGGEERLGNNGIKMQFFTNCGSRRVQAVHGIQKERKKERNEDNK